LRVQDWWEAHHQSSVRSRLHEAATELGMKINGKKTEVVKVCDDPKPITVTVVGRTLSETKSSKYLGAMFNSEASCDEVKSSWQSRDRDSAS